MIERDRINPFNDLSAGPEPIGHKKARLREIAGQRQNPFNQFWGYFAFGMIFPPTTLLFRKFIHWNSPSFNWIFVLLEGLILGGVIVAVKYIFRRYKRT